MKLFFYQHIKSLILNTLLNNNINIYLNRKMIRNNNIQPCLRRNIEYEINYDTQP